MKNIALADVNALSGDKAVLLSNIQHLHTTALGALRIKKIFRSTCKML